MTGPGRRKRSWNSLQTLLALGFISGPLAACDDPNGLQSSLQQALDEAEEADDEYNEEGNLKGHGRFIHQKTTGLPWASIGPAPPAVEAAVQVHVPTNTIYVATFGGGVLKSTDGGATFAEINNGLNSVAVATIAMDRNDPNKVLIGTAGGGIFRTVDGGATWLATSETSGLAISLAFDPNNSNVAYAGFVGGTVVKKTTNGGATWVNANAGLTQSVWSIAVDPNNSNNVYIGTSGAGALKSTNGGTSWSPLVVDTTVWSILVDPDNSNTIYAGANGLGVFKSTNAGASFSLVGSPDSGVVVALAKTNGKLYAGTITQGVSVSTDDGASWSNQGLPNGSGMALTAASDGSVYVGTNFDGVRKTVDGGGDWTRVAWNYIKDCNCQNSYGITVDPHKSQHLWYATQDGGLIETRSGASSWLDGGRNGFLNRAPRPVTFDPVDSSRLYAGSFVGGGVFLSDDGGKNWERRLVAPTVQITGVDVSPADRSVYAAGLGTGAGAYKSTDGGATFVRVDRQVAGGPLLNLAGRGVTVDQRHPNTVYLGTNSGVWRSQDAGATWSRRTTVFAFAITVDPTDSNIVYANTQTNGVMKSVDGGNSFAFINSGLSAAALRTSRSSGVQISSADHNVLYIGSEGGGVWKSVNAGATWAPVNDGLDNQSVLGLRIDPQLPNVLYAATTSSVYRTTTGGE